MEGGENPSTDNNTSFETENGWESLIGYESEPMATFATRALQKAKARERIQQDQKHSEPETQYKQQRKKDERGLGHIGTSKLDIRDKTTDSQAIRQELRDYGIDGADTLDELEDIEQSDGRVLSPEQVFKKFHGLFEFLGEDTEGNPNVIEEYQQITDKKEQLRFILSSPLADKIRLFCSDSFDYSNYDYFMYKLQFQQDFINGTAKVWRREWNSSKEEYIDVQIPLDPSYANPDDMARGLKRDALYSAMIGSPELASVKIATARINGLRSEDDAIKEAVCLHGFESGIDRGGSGRIGLWADLCDEYEIVLNKISETYEDDSPEQKEYKAVRKLAAWITGAFEYNGQIQDSDSPYRADFKEAIAAGRLSYGVMRQFRGMRLKIRWSDLHNIERFIGKSGYSQKRVSMMSKRSLLNRMLDHIEGLSSDDKQKFLYGENAFEIMKQKEWREKELERIQHKYDKLIDKTRSEERRAIYEQRRQEELQKTEQDVSERLAYFENRTVPELIADINSEIDSLSHKIEKRKSLAEKAIELYFKLDIGSTEWDEVSEEYIHDSKYHDCIDWINDAPFGVIKRAHRRMADGMPADEVYKLAIREVIRKTVNDPDQAEIAMNQMFSDVEDGSGNVQEILMITRLAGKLSKCPEKLSYSELKSMSSKNTRWIEEALAAFSPSDVKKFVDKELNLSLVPKLSRIAEEFGYKLDIDQLIELSSKGIIKSYYYKDVEGVFVSTLRNFSLDEAMTAMDANVDLKILNAIKPILSAQGIDGLSEILDRAVKIGQLSNNYDGGYEKLISQYRAAINSIGIEKADDLLSRGIDFNTYKMAIREFKDSVGDDFDKALKLSEKISIAMHGEPLDQEEASIRALRNANIGYTESQILNLYEHGVAASLYKKVFIGAEYDDDDSDAKENSSLDFNDKVKLLQNASKDGYDLSWRIRKAIESFDDDMLHRLAEGGADVIHAHRVKETLDRDVEYSEFNTPENVIYLALNHLEADVFLRAVNAGFSIDEIKLYPFLASDLLRKERTNNDTY